PPDARPRLCRFCRKLHDECVAARAVTFTKWVNERAASGQPRMGSVNMVTLIATSGLRPKLAWCFQWTRQPKASGRCGKVAPTGRRSSRVGGVVTPKGGVSASPRRMRIPAMTLYKALGGGWETARFLLR